MTAGTNHTLVVNPEHQLGLTDLSGNPYAPSGLELPDVLSGSLVAGPMSSAGRARLPSGAGRPATRRRRVVKSTVVRYRTKADRADENQRLVEGVFEDLRARAPMGFDYQVQRLDDGVSFVHVVDEEGDGGKVQVSQAFQRFTASLVEDRCADTPQLHQMTLVGSYSG